MRENYAKCLNAVLVFEGGFVNHPKDPGGRTNKGITQYVYNSWRKSKGLPTRDVKDIPMSEVTLIYKANYWDMIKGDELPSGLDLALFDFAVNSGVYRAIRFIQGIVGVRPDGVMGPITLKAIKESDKDLVLAICNERMKFLKGLSTWHYFGKGWTNRVASVVSKSKGMVA